MGSDKGPIQVQLSSADTALPKGHVLHLAVGSNRIEPVVWQPEDACILGTKAVTNGCGSVPVSLAGQQEEAAL